MLTTIPLFLGMRGAQLIFIIVVILLIFGVARLPKIMRNMGRGVHQFKQGLEDAKEEINKPIRRADDRRDDDRYRDDKANDRYDDRDHGCRDRRYDDRYRDYRADDRRDDRYDDRDRRDDDRRDGRYRDRYTDKD